MGLFPNLIIIIMTKIYTMNLRRSNIILQQGLILIAFMLLLAQPIRAQYFTKILSGTLVETPKKPYSAAWADYNGDGFDDVIIIDSEDYHTSLFTNNGDGTFSENTSNAIYENDGPSIACTWGDYNNDGHIDLYICNTGNNGGAASANFLYRNDGDGIFTKIEQGEIVTDQGWSLGAAWADYDNDGFLDLYVANFTEENCLYHNNGDESFTKITEGEMVTDNFNTYSACWSDYDNDGFQDLFVVNFYYSDLPGQNDCLYHNNGDGTFTKNTSALIANDLALSQGASWGDFNNDGWLDLFVTVNNFADIDHNFLYKNNGAGDFTLVSASPSTDGSASFGAAWLDINNDGFLDLTVSNNGSSTKRLNYLYLNNGDETFTNQDTDEATTTPLRDFCTSISDYDHNGYPDMFTPSYSTSLIHGLYQNNGGTNNYLTVRLEGTISNRSGIGARIRCYAGGTAQTHEVSSTSGQYCGSSLAQTFGIGTATAIDSITINWPSGIHQVITNPSINEILNITESIDLNTENDILTFDVPNQVGSSDIDMQNHTVTALVTSGTSLEAISPVITISEGATIDPASGESVDFSNGPVNYTVTAENGDIQVWQISISAEILPNDETDILSFDLDNQTEPATIDLGDYTVTAYIPYEASLTSLTPIIEVSEGATINPDSGETVDFSNGAVDYTVTAENGTDVQIWSITVNAGHVGISNKDYSNASLSIYPNPSHGDVNVNMTTSLTGNYKIEILNQMGQIISKYSIRLNGNESKNITVKNLSQGIYTVRLSGNGYIATSKMIITE